VSSRVRAHAVLALAWVLSGCSPMDGPVTIRTQSQPLTVCDQARVGGTLVGDSTYGLALQNPGYRNGVVWPYGYTARRESGVILLIGPAGVVVAREGDRIQAAGGSRRGYGTRGVRHSSGSESRARSHVTFGDAERGNGQPALD
jgi:hypothetical protein